MARARGEIAFEDVSIAYEAKHPILRGITLNIKPGQTVALARVGAALPGGLKIEKAVIRGQESKGMLFAVSDDAGHFSLLEPNSSIPPGTPAK